MAESSVQSLCNPYLHHTLYAEIVELSAVDSIPLPSRLNVEDISKYLELPSDMEALYSGPGTQVIHAGAVRSNYPIPPECGLFYFEMRVLNRGVEGYIGIGVCAADNDLNRLPGRVWSKKKRGIEIMRRAVGWDRHSWGYHGDDGKTFGERGRGKVYGPKFTTGDVIGCGIDMARGRAFYTKNGLYLGIAFTTIDISIALYPCIGLNTCNEQVSINFGQQPFVFDIEGHVRKLRQEIMRDITEEWGAM